MRVRLLRFFEARDANRGLLFFSNVSENVFYGSAGSCQVICNQNPLLMPLDVLRNSESLMATDDMDWFA